MEAALELRLSNRNGAPDRIALLAELSCYAHALVSEARRGPAVPVGLDERTRTVAWLVRPVFVCGHHRAGTTVMRQLLDGHPDLLVLPSEGTYFTSFRYAARPSPTAADMDRFIAEWISRFVDPNGEPHFRIGRTELRDNPSLRFASRVLAWHEGLRHGPPALTPFAALLALVAAFRDVAAPGQIPRWWVEKTPLNEHFVERLARFSEARFIHMVRDPGATLDSLLAAQAKGGVKRANRAELAYAIGQSLRRARTNATRFGSRYLIVRYEDLVSYPPGEMNRVRLHLGLSAHASLAVPTESARPARANSSFGAGAPGVILRPNRNPPSDPVNDRLISAFNEAVARPFGYEVGELNDITRTALRARHLPSIWIRRLRTQFMRRT